MSARPGLVRRAWLALAGESVVFAALLFGAAGTVRWAAGWVFLGLFFGAAGLITRRLARDDPALLAERMKPPRQTGQPLWDRMLLAAMGVLFAGWLVAMGLDAGRFHASAVPLWLQALGGVGVALGMGICGRAFRENTFLAPVVRIQSERGQRVVSTGPYAVVRHPLYAGVLLFFPATALLLGSWWGLAGAGLLAAGLVARTALEDRALRRDLPGYADYAARVRYRLIPYIW